MCRYTLCESCAAQIHLIKLPTYTVVCMFKLPLDFADLNQMATRCRRPTSPPTYFSSHKATFFIFIFIFIFFYDFELTITEGQSLEISRGEKIHSTECHPRGRELP